MSGTFFLDFGLFILHGGGFGRLESWGYNVWREGKEFEAVTSSKRGKLNCGESEGMVTWLCIQW